MLFSAYYRRGLLFIRKRGSNRLALAVVGTAVEQDGNLQESAPENPAPSGRVTGYRV